MKFSLLLWSTVVVSTAFWSVPFDLAIGSGDAASTAPYLPIEGQRPERPKYTDKIDRYRGAMREEFHAAMTARDLSEAKLRWEIFLKVHNPSMGMKEGYEDGSHIRLVRAGQYELVRIYYLIGQQSAADGLLRETKQEDSFFQGLYDEKTKSGAPEIDKSSARTYTPLDGLVAIGLKYNGVHADEFNAAAQAPTLEQARTLWEAFLNARKSGKRNSADPSQHHYIRQAQYELVRIYYLLGEEKGGDALLKSLKHGDQLFEGFYDTEHEGER